MTPPPPPASLPSSASFLHKRKGIECGSSAVSRKHEHLQQKKAFACVWHGEWPKLQVRPEKEIHASMSSAERTGAHCQIKIFNFGSSRLLMLPSCTLTFPSQFLRRGTTVLNFDADTSQVIPVFLKLESCHGTVTWCRPPWADLRHKNSAAGSGGAQASRVDRTVNYDFQIQVSVLSILWCHPNGKVFFKKL